MKNIEKELLILEKEKRNKVMKRYSYYKEVGYDLIFDEKLNTEFSSSREDFEKCKEKYSVDYPCEISLRRISNENNETIGFAKETVIYFDNQIKFQLLFESAFKEIVDLLGVKDITSFSYFVDNYADTEDFFTEDMFISSKIRTLIEIYDKYQEDSDFKEFLNKVIL